MSVCEQETGVRRKCRNTLPMGKCGESPHRGTSGNLVTRAPWDGCPCLSNTGVGCTVEATGAVEGAGDEGGCAPKSTGPG